MLPHITHHRENEDVESKAGPWLCSWDPSGEKSLSEAALLPTVLYFLKYPLLPGAGQILI